ASEDLPSVLEVGPKVARQAFVDDHNRLGRSRVHRRELASAQEWNPHCLEIAQADAMAVRHDWRARGWRRVSLGAVLIKPPHETERKEIGDGDRTHAGRRG